MLSFVPMISSSQEQPHMRAVMSRILFVIFRINLMG